MTSTALVLKINYHAIVTVTKKQTVKSENGIFTFATLLL